MKNHRSILLGAVFFGLICFTTTAYSQPYDASPSTDIIIPEAIWAAASGGGTWMTEFQVVDFTSISGTQVSIYVYLMGEDVRGPFNFWTSPGAYNTYKGSNLLQNIQSVDPAHSDYYGRVGAVRFVTNDSLHVIQVSVRTYNGSYSKTFNGLPWNREGNSASIGREMVVPNIVNNWSYRTAVGIVNTFDDTVQVQFLLMDNTNHAIGTPFTKTINPRTFTAFNPFAEAGVSSGSYSNHFLYINPLSGTANLFCFGATTHNITNDPAAHVAIPFDF
jgi:hypothetical protein